MEFIFRYAGYIVVFIAGLLLGRGFYEEKLMVKFPDFYRAIRLQEIDEDIANCTNARAKEGERRG